MIPFFVIFEVVLILFRVSLPYLSQFVQLFEEWQTAMTWICVIVGVIAGVFIVVNLCGVFRNRKGKE